MDIQIITASISAVATIICAAMARSNKIESERRAKIDARNEEQSNLRAKEGRLQLKMLEANSQLTVGVAMALKNGHCNGDVERGLQLVQDAQEDYRAFLEGLAIDKIRK